MKRVYFTLITRPYKIRQRFSTTIYINSNTILDFFLFESFLLLKSTYKMKEHKT